MELGLVTIITISSANMIGLDLLCISVCISQLCKEGRAKDLELKPFLTLALGGGGEE
jgi:hypothetical protein